MEKVILLPRVRDKLESLAGLLFNKGYFAMQKNAFAYVDAIYNFIYTISQRQRSATNNRRYGDWFCRYSQTRKRHGTLHLIQMGRIGWCEIS